MRVARRILLFMSGLFLMVTGFNRRWIDSFFLSYQIRVGPRISLLCHFLPSWVIGLAG